MLLAIAANLIQIGTYIDSTCESVYSGV